MRTIKTLSRHKAEHKKKVRASPAVKVFRIESERETEGMEDQYDLFTDLEEALTFVGLFKNEKEIARNELIQDGYIKLHSFILHLL